MSPTLSRRFGRAGLTALTAFALAAATTAAHPATPAAHPIKMAARRAISAAHPASTAAYRAGTAAHPAGTAAHGAIPAARSTAATAPAAVGGTDPLQSVPVRRACNRPLGPHQATCLALVRTDVAAHRGIQALHAPTGLGAGDLQRAYNLPASSAGRGQTVAIIDVYDNPNAESDLAVYRAQYGLPPCTTANGCFTKVNENGGTALPAPDTGWAEEESLDLDMVSAACPNCHILLVESSRPNLDGLGTGVNTAVRLGAKYVSNSYGGREDGSTLTYDRSYFDHPGIAITAASGDSGYGVLYPSASRHVTAVGGTSLSRAANARGWAETAWSGAGSGCSAYVAKPAWQRDTGCARRTVTDVSAVADPRTGVAVYDTYGAGGWLLVGGTSASAPIIAGAYALAGPPASGALTAAIPYAHAGAGAGAGAGALNDITSGSNGTCSPAYLCTAGPGYDGPTGFGTPNGVIAFTGTPPTLAKPGGRQPDHAGKDGRAAPAPGPAPGRTTTPGRTTAPGRTTTAGGTTTAGQTTAAGTTAAGPAATAGRTGRPVAAGRGAATQPAPHRTGTIANGGFETGDLSGWTASGVVTGVTAAGPHGGRYTALLGDPDEPRKGDSSIRQSFTTAAHQRALSFWYNVSCPDRETYDWALATLRDDTTGATRTVLPKTCTYEEPWQRVNTPITGGHAYTLTLLSHDDGYFGDPTATRYDDVSLS